MKEMIAAEVRLRPHIWMTRHEDYRNNFKKTRAFQEIAEKVALETVNEMDGQVCATTWASLRKYYNTHAKERICTGDGVDTKPCHPWKFSKDIEFLKESQEAITMPRVLMGNGTRENYAHQRDSVDIEAR
ncbi:hypothetical protein QR680_017374 [Steinernema hermaphroditum]|uniref:MADF domain-containing protein n=1 Tax=Steinernema hermaphroditum TaxID=289476 RepID=A0AA39LNW1_9BILA|nr:hypothetical protein QR680_017374 [Steinernema hermaphroditum]